MASRVFVIAFAFFVLTAARFEARVTDLSALRVLDGQVPYRDFWTMYAPGSFVALAGAFAVFGRELLVSNMLGVATSAAAVTVYYRVATLLAGPRVALLPTAIVTAAFVGAGYHDGFTSYPPFMLLTCLTLVSVARRCSESGAVWAVAPGLMIGAAALFKHDVAAYSAIAAVIALVRARSAAGLSIVGPVFIFGMTAFAVVAAAAGLLVGLDAGPDLWRDLVIFPLVDFRHVRPEHFPLLPQIRSSLVGMARELLHWSRLYLPLLALAIGVRAAWRTRRELTIGQHLIVWFASIAFVFHWLAAQVQLNTHAISLAAWGALAGTVGLCAGRSRESVTWPGRAPLVGGVAAWLAVVLVEPSYAAAQRIHEGTEWVQLPGLRGIRVVHSDAAWMRSLSAALAGAADQNAPLLLVANRNDAVIFVDGAPFLLGSRRPATRYHELHPGVTDTATIQREMVEDLQREPIAVLVREYRFSGPAIERFKAGLLAHVPVGSTYLDNWVAANYASGQRFGRYELMHPLKRD